MISVTSQQISTFRSPKLILKNAKTEMVFLKLHRLSCFVSKEDMVVVLWDLLTADQGWSRRGEEWFIFIFERSLILELVETRDSEPRVCYRHINVMKTLGDLALDLWMDAGKGWSKVTHKMTARKKASSMAWDSCQFPSCQCFRFMTVDLTIWIILYHMATSIAHLWLS